MEMAYHGNENRGRILIAVGVILALVAGGTSFYILNSQQAAPGPTSVDRKPVVVAVRLIGARTAITPADVAVRQVAIEAANAAGTVDTTDKVVGRIPAVSILAGQPVTENMLASAVDSGGPFSILEPTETIGPDSEAWRAVSITVPANRAVGGFVQIGQTVDIFATAAIAVPPELLASGDYVAAQSTKIVFQNMLILARQGDEYVIRATLPVAEEINHLLASAGAIFSIALRPDIDVREADATVLGTTTNEVISKYGLPIPQVLPAPAGAAAATTRPSASPRVP
jgi:Flp pilus assembly protein CpaB